MNTLQLPTNELGNRGITVSRMGFGSAPIGNSAHVSAAQAIATVHYALEQGITLFDTAPLYGAGRAEELLGMALEGVPRSQFVLSTKVGRILDESSRTLTFDYSRDGVLRSLESSLKRLKLDRVDLLLIHDPDNHSEQALAEAYPTLAELRSQGVIGAVGAGMNQWQVLSNFAQASDFDCFLLAGRYTLLEQTSLDFLELCRSRGIGILLGGVFNSGILAMGAVEGATYNYAAAPPAIVEKTNAIAAICARHNVKLSAAALQFAQAHPAISTLVIGAIAPEEIAANLAALQVEIPAALWVDLQEAGLVRADAPMPSLNAIA
jgi:D-threo-aldose 1-dehydrogenase